MPQATGTLPVQALGLTDLPSLRSLGSKVAPHPGPTPSLSSWPLTAQAQSWFFSECVTGLREASHSLTCSPSTHLPGPGLPGPLRVRRGGQVSR